MASTAQQDAKACTAEEQERKKLKPSYNIEDAAQLLKKHFNVPATDVKELDSYDDQNFKVASPYGTYVLKAHNGVESRNTQLLDAQSQLLKHLEEHSIRAPVEAQSRVSLKKTTLRLLRWVDGDVLSSSVMTPSLLTRAGSFLGDIRKALDTFDHQALHRLHLWDLRRFPAVATFSSKLRSMDCDASRVKLVETCIENYSSQNFDNLPMATLHGDFNDANILLHGKEWGILDVGDCVYSWRVNDVAIGAAYVMVNLCTSENKRSGFSDKGDHVAVQGAQKFVEGFLQRSTLSKDECRALPHLIAARLATSFTRVSRRPFRRLERGVVASMAWWWCAVLRDAVDARRSQARLVLLPRILSCPAGHASTTKRLPAPPRAPRGDGPRRVPRGDVIGRGLAYHKTRERP